MTDLYLNGEERFGLATSVLYLAAGFVPQIRRMYRYAAADVLKCGGPVLDVGCGPGSVIRMLCRNGYSGRIYGIDPSSHMIRIANLFSGGCARFAVGSSRHVPFRIKFGTIISSLSFHHWSMKEDSLRYLKRLLAPNGTIRIYEFETSYAKRISHRISAHSMSETEIRASAKIAGLTVRRISRSGGIIAAVLSV